jgi:hypothetical protein
MPRAATTRSTSCSPRAEGIRSMASRWDRLLDIKPIPIAEHLLEEIGKLLAADLATWPLPVSAIDPVLGKEFMPLLEPGNPRPSRAVFAESFALARFELTHEHDAFDDYMRNKRYLERGVAETDRQALLFISRWLVDQMTGLGEATEGRVKRPQMISCLDRAERRLRHNLS